MIGGHEQFALAIFAGWVTPLQETFNPSRGGANLPVIFSIFQLTASKAKFNK